MQDQRNVVGSLVDAVQSLEVQTLPVGRVDAVDVADAGSEEIDAQIGDLCACLLYTSWCMVVVSSCREMLG